MFSFTTKQLLYRMLNEHAAKGGMQMYVLDGKDEGYQIIEHKRKIMGISEESMWKLQRVLREDYPFVCLLKSERYLGPSEVAKPFAKFGITKDDVHFLTSKNAKKDPNWGDLAAGNKLHLYYIPIDIEGTYSW